MTTEDGLRALRDAMDQAPSIRPRLDADYLRAIAAAESLPANQTGADKSWVWEAQDAFRRHYAGVQRT